MAEPAVQNGWQTRRFNDIAFIVNDRVDDPSHAGVDRYVGLEHLDPDSLTISRWGSPDDVEATKLRFRVGDIIFGRRRVYQRKLGVADFDGICSAHAMVLRANPDVLIPDFLPFFMQSDLFMQRALEISVGSLSPTINWKTLAKEEFALPPPKEQRRIVNLMHRSRELEDQYAQLAKSYEAVARSMIDAHVERIVPGGTRLAALGQWGNVSVVSLDAALTLTDCKHRTPTLVEDGIPMVAPGDIEWGPLRLEGCKRIAPSEYVDFMDHVAVSVGDLVLSRNQTYGIAAYVVDDEPFALGQDTVLLQTALYPASFVYVMLQSTFVQYQIERYAMGSTFKRINLGDIRRLRIPAADPSQIEAVTALSRALENQAATLEQRRRDCIGVRKLLLNAALDASGTK